ncbi:hypothetical protein MPTK2_8g15897 [Marchantia polymorpha subsp. ruderalis]
MDSTHEEPESRAAETLGMDSIDEEPESFDVSETDEQPKLPSAVQYLIRLLEGKGQPLRNLYQRLFNPEIREFFPDSAALSTITGWRSQVRLRVLEAIGNCNTFEDLTVPFIYYGAKYDEAKYGEIVRDWGDISRLTASEWEIVCRGFMSSTVLKEISLSQLRWGSDEEVESFCLQLGGILNSSSVTHLTIRGCELNARCWLNLASGLRGHSDSKLQTLDLKDAWEDSSAVKHVAEMINSAPLLQTLILRESPKTDDEAVGMLSQALIQSSSLQKLSLWEVEWGAALLLKALAGDDGNRSIERLILDGMDGLGDCLRQVLSSNPSLKEVCLDSLRMSPEEWQQLGEVIRDKATATTINVRFFLSQNVEHEWKSIEAVACAASSDVKDPTMELDIYSKWLCNDDVMFSMNLLGRVLGGEIKSIKDFSISGFVSSGSNEDRLESILSMNGNTGETSVLKKLRLNVVHKDVWKVLLRGLRGNTSLTHLYLSPSKMEEEVFMDAMGILRENTTLTHLALTGSELHEEAFRDVMGILRENTTITHLALTGLKLHEVAFRDLMGLLQINLTLQDIDVNYTSWTMDGKEALIKEALKQNQKRAGYMSVFCEAKLAFGDAKAGRLFLCGSPLAGKTQVRQTLMRIVKGQSWIGNKVKKLRRTKGIEVEYLQNNDRSQISIWDLAGQGIFRTLQNVIFPQSNNFCIFLFVYSPFREEDSSWNGTVFSAEKEEDCFETELEEWLCFITSSTRITGHSLPQVLVVITHKDKVPYSSLKWAENIIGTLTKRFANFVDLHQEVFHLDARKKKEVIPLQNHIFENFKNLLCEKSPRVPQLCSHLYCLLVSNTKKNRSCPLLPSKDFNEICAPSLTEFVPSSSTHSVGHERIMSAIISYLNDVGSIISIPNLDYIIVDPNWLTYTLLGKLVALGQNFQPIKSRSFERSAYASKDGFVSEIVFVRLMEEFLRKQPHGQGGVTTQVLEDILINLDLCFKVEDTSQYFIPSFIPEHANTEDQKPQELAWETRDKNSQFVGIRIQCQDARTMALTAAFFPCFQMFMRRKLISELNVSKKNVTCSRHYLQLFLDGHEIYIEQGTSHKYVDVLMLRSKHKSRSEALQYVMKHIVEELKSFCASPKGCPGVALVLGVIQTLCVEKLIPSHLRGAILIEELKSNFIRSINEKLEEILSNRLHLVKDEDLLNYEQSWPSIEGHTLKIGERARYLLRESDVKAVVNEIRQRCVQQLSNDLDQPYSESDNRVGNSSSSYRFERLRSIESKLGHILTSQQELQPTRVNKNYSLFRSEVDRLIQYFHSLQQAKTPKIPYVANDVGIFYSMSAKLHLGKTVRLHLMCESVDGFHMVKDQEGVMIRLDRENCAWIQKTVEITCKVMYYAVKAGLDKTLNLGQAIPNWEDLQSDIFKLEGISDRDRRAVRKGGKSMELNEAWLRIQQTLEPQLRDSYSARFKLYQVKYVSQELDEHGLYEHAWVCEECMHKGLNSRVLIV